MCFSEWSMLYEFAYILCFFFTIVSLKQRIQSNKSKKILLGVLEGQMGKPPRRGSLPSGGIPPFRHEIPLERGIQVQTSLKKMGTEHSLFRPVFFNVGVPCCSKAKTYACLRITFIYMYICFGRHASYVFFRMEHAMSYCNKIILFSLLLHQNNV